MGKNEYSYRGIKGKLVAATCMLLVSCIMVVSSTYAWFTLSTAPEVTGIQTAVGANGSLEMALVPKNGDLTTIGSSATDGNLPWDERNVTWGNLVDLSNFYGLDQIVLYPAALNGEDGTLNETIPLKTPEYGSDGRVTALNQNTLTSAANEAQQFMVNNERGVRAVGTASGMTPRQLSLRSAKAGASTSVAYAKNVAALALSQNGNALADIAIKKANGTADFTKAEIEPLGEIIDALLGTPAVTGSLEYIDDAYKQYILAFFASDLSGTADAAWSTVKGLVDAENSTARSVINGIADLTGAQSIPAEVTAGITAYEATLAAVNTAKTKYDTLLTTLETAETVAWTGGVSDVVAALADSDKMQLNGTPITELLGGGTEGAGFNKLVQDVMSGKGLTLGIVSGGGVFADIADHCGDYSANVEIKDLSYKGLSAGTVKATMATATTKNGANGNSLPYLKILEAAAVSLQAPAATVGAATPISDFYGYIIDLAFRTNASDSELLLQTDAIDRIYGDNSNEDTMGGGSSMTFQTASSSFDADAVKGLMNAIRVVFFTPGGATSTVLGEARLDTANVTFDANGYTAKLKMVGSGATTTTRYEAVTDTSATNKTYYIKTTADKYEEVQLTTGTSTDGYYIRQAGNDNIEGTADDTYVTATGNAVAGTKYYKKTPAGSYVTATAEEIADDSITKYVQTTVNTTGTSNVITPLVQNQATAVSVLVYLDGNNMGNDDVAADVAKSMTGTMNLQFASSATLKPMEYAALHTPGSSTGGTDTPTLGENEVAVIVPEGVTGVAKATKNIDYNFTVNTATHSLGEVTVGGVVVTPTDNSNGSYTIPADKVTGAIVIKTTAIQP